MKPWLQPRPAVRPISGRERQMSTAGQSRRQLRMIQEWLIRGGGLGPHRAGCLRALRADAPQLRWARWRPRRLPPRPGQTEGGLATMFHARRLLLCDAQLQVQPHPHRTTSMSLGKVAVMDTDGRA